MDQKLRLQTEHRIVTIDEIDLSALKIIVHDQYQTVLYISLQFNHPIVVMPRVGEVWVAKRNGQDWFLEKRLSTSTLRTLQPGDILVEGNKLRLNASITLPVSSEPDDSTIEDNSVEMWFDGANINFKAKTNDGTVKQGSIPLV